MNGDAFDHDQAVQRAESLVPLLAAEAPEAERIRSLTPEVMDAVTGSGLFATVSPRRWGGMGLGLRTVGEVTRILAHGCPAQAWTLSFLVLHNWFISRFAEPAQAEVFASRPWANVAAPLAPTGTLERTPEGYRLSGSWDWATGVNHAEWVLLHAVDREALETGGSPTRFALLPIDEVEVVDTWFTSGMRATGSNRVRADAVHVGEDFTIPGDRMLDSGTGQDGLDALPLMSVLALVAAAPALGAAESATDLFASRMQERVLAYTLGARQVDQPASLIRLSAATAERAAAAAYWRDTVSALEAVERVTVEDRGAARLAAAKAVAMARSAISVVCEASGASVYSETSPLQRIQRDVEVLKGHVVFDWDRSAELAGRVALGMELGPTDMV